MTDDPSGMAWYNPAGLAKLKGKSFSAAVGIYKKFDIRYNEDSELSNASLRVNQGFFQPIPSSLGNVIRPEQIPWLADWTLALSILVPEYETFKGDISVEGNSVSSLTLTTQSLWVGGAMAKMLNARDSFGFTFYYTARSVSKSVNDRTYVDATHSNIFTEERNITQNALVAILGWHRDIDDHWKIGTSYRFPGLPVAGKATIDRTTITNGSIDPKNVPDAGTKAHIPWKAAVGVAYVKENRDRWALDVNAYGAESYGDVEDGEYSEKIENRQTYNISVGYEKEWVEWFRTRVGFFSNYSSHPNPDPQLVQGQGDHVDQVGFSANFDLKSGNIDYTFGGYYTGGRGESVQRVNQNYQVVTKVENIFTMLVGTSYYF